MGIMIGPGTGLAPMRGFIQDRISTNATGENRLYFGCRGEVDYLYKDELEAWNSTGKIHLRTAFSRQTKDKVYVQHLLEKDGMQVWQLLEQGAHVYVCGDAKYMAVDVR